MFRNFDRCAGVVVDPFEGKAGVLVDRPWCGAGAASADTVGSFVAVLEGGVVLPDVDCLVATEKRLA